MCQALRDMMKDELNQAHVFGKQQGLQQGIQQERIKNAKAFLEKGLASAIVAECTGLSLAQVEQLAVKN